MASRSTGGDAVVMSMGMWLIFTEKGDVRLTRTTPALNSKERAMQLTLNVPRSIFKTPSLKGTITLSDANFEQRIAEVACDAADALRAAGLDLSLSVVKSK